jgi:hypothetical protein
MNNKLALFLLIWFSLSVLAIAFHHHEDGVSHEDCSICFSILLHSNMAFQDTPQVSLPTFLIPVASLETTVSFPSPCCSPYLNRAPPVQYPSTKAALAKEPKKRSIREND